MQTEGALLVKEYSKQSGEELLSNTVKVRDCRDAAGSFVSTNDGASFYAAGRASHIYALGSRGDLVCAERCSGNVGLC